MYSSNNWLVNRQYLAKSIRKSFHVLNIPSNIVAKFTLSSNFLSRGAFGRTRQISASAECPASTLEGDNPHLIVFVQRSFVLNQQVLSLAIELLRPQGILLVKAFQGTSLEGLRRAFLESFDRVKLCKPKSSRAESVEIYLLGLGKKQ